MIFKNKNLKLEEKNFIYLAELIFHNLKEDAYILRRDGFYNVSIFYLGRRSIYQVNEDKIKEPKDIYLEVTKIKGFIDLKKEKDGNYIIHYRPIIVSFLNKEFILGFFLENSSSGYIKLRNDLEFFCNEYPFLKTVKDNINYELILIFEKYNSGKIKLFDRYLIQEYLSLDKPIIESISDKSRIENILLDKYK